MPAIYLKPGRERSLLRRHPWIFSGAIERLQGDPATMPHNTLLRLATRGSALALGFKESGVLRPGAPADIVLFGTQNVHWIPRHDLAAGVVYASHPGDVRYVICDGQVLLRNGELTTLDEERIRYEAEKRAFRMVGQPMQQVREYHG